MMAQATISDEGVFTLEGTSLAEALAILDEQKAIAEARETYRLSQQYLKRVVGKTLYVKLEGIEIGTAQIYRGKNVILNGVVTSSQKPWPTSLSNTNCSRKIIMTANKPMTGEQLDELMTVAVNMQRDAETDCNSPSAMFAYAVQVAVLELRKVRNAVAALAAENAGLKAICDDRRMFIMNGVQLGYIQVRQWKQTRHLKTIRVAVSPQEQPGNRSCTDEVRAQGVDVAIEYLINKFAGTGRIGVPVMALEWLALELRKGAQP